MEYSDHESKLRWFLAKSVESYSSSVASGKCCCNATQIESFIAIGVTAILSGLLWYSVIAAPLKLIAVFLHEFSHASATWLTCGKVTGIEVNENFGGVTYSRGGIRCITLSAGYTGSVFWGCFFILMTWAVIPTRVAAAIFICACVATAIILRIKERKTCAARCAFGILMRSVIVFIAAIIAGLWVLETYVPMKVHPLRWCILILGTVCTLHALYDCIHDVLLKKIDNESQGQSDAIMFSNEFCGGCISARLWGLIWSLIALCAVAASLYGLTVLSADCRY